MLRKSSERISVKQSSLLWSYSFLNLVLLLLLQLLFFRVYLVPVWFSSVSVVEKKEYWYYK